MPSGDKCTFGTGRDRHALRHAAPYRDVRLGPRRDDVLVIARVGAGRADHETDGQLARHDVEHRFDARGLDAADPRRNDDDVGALDRLGEQALVAGRRVDDRDVLGVDPVECLEQQPVGRRLDQRQPLEVLVLGALDPVGGAGLRIGIDQRGRPAGGRERREVHRCGRLADPALECRDHDDHRPNVSSRDASPQPSTNRPGGPARLEAGASRLPTSR